LQQSGCQPCYNAGANSANKKFFNHGSVAGKSHRVALVVGSVVQGCRLSVSRCK
jgi:hypothetical protein